MATSDIGTGNKTWLEKVGDIIIPTKHTQTNHTSKKKFGNNSNSTENIEPKYVSVCVRTFDSRRTGNMMFVLAALLYVSKHTGRLPIMPQKFPHGWIDAMFINDLKRFPNKFIYDPNISVIVSEASQGPTYDPKFRNLHSIESYKNAKIILICGYFQSYRYVADVEQELKYYLQFRNSTLKSVDDFIEKESNISSNVSFIGLHVRRGDFVYPSSLKSGLTVVDDKYINASMNYAINSFNNSNSIVAFICSNDIKWIQTIVRQLRLAHLYPNLKIVFSSGHHPDFDLCLLSKCHVTIISTGTYSWWAGWLSNTTTVYYSLYPNRKTAFGAKFKVNDYYPRTWKGLP